MAGRAQAASEAIQGLRRYIEGKTVQPGMFSTMDRLIQQAPFERAPADEWLGYLKPGRMLKDDGAQFPLKAEEVRESRIAELLERESSDSLTGSLGRDRVLEVIRGERPQFGLTIQADSLPNETPIPRAWLDAADSSEMGSPEHLRLSSLGRIKEARDTDFGPLDEEYARLSFQSPGSIYEESITRMGDLGFKSHFTDDTLSWSRTSSHPNIQVSRVSADGAPSQGTANVRLVDEIQSDLHQKAADKILEDPRSGHTGSNAREVYGPEEISDSDRARLIERRRGYRTPEMESRKRELEPSNNRLSQGLMQEHSRIERTPPPAPFGSPSEYGALELRKQLLNAAESDQDYLAIVNGDAQVSRNQSTGKDAEGMRHIYDSVYRGELEKLARRFGATTEDITMRLSTGEEIRPEIMVDADFETIDELGDWVWEAIDEGKEWSSSPDNSKDSAEWAEQAVDSFYEVMYDLEAKLEGVGNDFETSEWSIRKMKERMAVLRTQASTRNFKDVDSKEFESLVIDMEHLFRAVGEMRGVNGRTLPSTFRAIKLTPEIRERIKRIGVPLWSAFGAAMLPDQEEQPEEEPQRFADGGRVRPRSTSLSELSEMIEQMNMNDAEATGYDRSHPSRSQFLPRVAHGFSSMWKSLNPETGQAEWVVPESMVAPDQREEYSASHPQGFRPGIVDEFTSIPSVVGLGGERSREASERFETLSRDIAGDLGLEEAVGPLQHGGEMLGMMLGQVPVPASMLKNMATVGKSVIPSALKNIAGGIPGVIKNPLRAASEFFNPVVTPGVGTYGGGAAFGAALGTMMGDPSEMNMEELEAEYNRLSELAQTTPRTLWSIEDQIAELVLEDRLSEMMGDARAKNAQLDREVISNSAESGMSRR